jgi:hypothetical protein
MAPGSFPASILNCRTVLNTKREPRASGLRGWPNEEVANDTAVLIPDREQGSRPPTVYPLKVRWAGLSTCKRPLVSHEVPEVPVMQILMEGDQ